MSVLIPTVGKGIASARLGNLNSQAAPIYQAWGIGTSGPAAGDTAMGTESAPTATTRITGSASQVTTSTTNDTLQVTATVTAGGSLAITESGLFDAATPPGTLFLRSVFSVINLSSGDSISFTNKIQLS